MVRDFFDETKVPILYMDMMKAMETIQDLSFDTMEKFNDMAIGAYQILGKLEDVPLNIPESNSVSYNLEEVMEANKIHPANELGKFAGQSGAVGYYFNKPSDHLYTPLLKTEEERTAYAESGVAAIQEVVEKFDMNRVVQALKEVDDYT